MSISRNALLRGTVGIAVSVVAIWILIQSVDIAAAFDVLSTASPFWIAVMLVTTTVDVGARGARWRALLAPIAAASDIGGSSATPTSATWPTTSCRHGSGSCIGAMPSVRARA